MKVRMRDHLRFFVCVIYAIKSRIVYTRFLGNYICQSKSSKLKKIILNKFNKKSLTKKKQIVKRDISHW